MKNKNITVIIIFLVVALLIGGGIYAFYSFGKEGTVDNTEATSEDGSASLSATFFDFSGNQAGGVAQSLIAGTSKRTHVLFELRATNTGDVALTNVDPVSPNVNMNGAFDNVNPLSTLSVGASNILVGSSGQACTSNAMCNTNEECCNIGTGQCGSVTGGTCVVKLDNYASANANTPNNVQFSISLSASYTNPQGGTNSITSSPVTLTYDIRGEACSDGTGINTCVNVDTQNTNQFCDWTEGSLPQIVTDCRGADGIAGNTDDCGCATGYECQSGGTCASLTCADGTAINQFSTATGTYTIYLPGGGSGSYAVASGFVTNLNKTRVYCTSGQQLQASCNLAKTQLGGGVLTNELACKKDALGRYASTCSPTSGDPSTCVYAPVSPGISGTIGEG